MPLGGGKGKRHRRRRVAWCWKGSAAPQGSTVKLVYLSLFPALFFRIFLLFFCRPQLLSFLCGKHNTFRQRPSRRAGARQFIQSSTSSEPASEFVPPYEKNSATAGATVVPILQTNNGCELPDRIHTALATHNPLALTISPSVSAQSDDCHSCVAEA